MKYSLTTSTLLSLASSAAVLAQDNNCYQEKGNWYCSAVQAISYSNFGVAGKYQKVTVMGANGECDFAGQGYSGGMAPMDGEVSSMFFFSLYLSKKPLEVESEVMRRMYMLTILGVETGFVALPRPDPIEAVCFLHSRLR